MWPLEVGREVTEPLEPSQVAAPLAGSLRTYGAVYSRRVVRHAAMASSSSARAVLTDVDGACCCGCPGRSVVQPPQPGSPRTGCGGTAGSVNPNRPSVNSLTFRLTPPSRDRPARHRGRRVNLQTAFRFRSIRISPNRFHKRTL